jgi:thiol-disulfide isomerase/thioredoxin
MTSTHRAKQDRLTFAVVAFLWGALPAFAQGGSAAVGIRELRPYGDYVLVVDGKEVPNAEIFFAEKAPAFLVITSKLDSPVLLAVRRQTVETVQLMKVSRQENGTVDLLANATLAPQGSFTVVGEGSEVNFTVDRHPVQLRTRPPLLGLHAASDLKAYNPLVYVDGGRSYRPDHQVVAALKRASPPVTVRVYFGSWCPHCQHYVPLLLRVEDELKGSKIKFEYFGLSRDGLASDPEVKRLGINEVPTGIVLIKGKEAGRVIGNSAWATPELSLATIVNGAAASR